KLVDDLNQLAPADSGALAYRKQTLDVVPLLTQALESHRERLAERGLAVETSWNGAARVFGDADRLRQMFRNLLENSARYTDRCAARRRPGARRLRGLRARRAERCAAAALRAVLSRGCVARPRQRRHRTRARHLPQHRRSARRRDQRGALAARRPARLAFPS